MPYSLAEKHNVLPSLCMQAAEASARLADANTKMGNASVAASVIHQQLPSVAAVAPLKVKAKVLSAMADLLLVSASESDIEEHPDR